MMGFSTDTTLIMRGGRFDGPAWRKINFLGLSSCAWRGQIPWPRRRNEGEGNDPGSGMKGPAISSRE